MPKKLTLLVLLSWGICSVAACSSERAAGPTDGGMTDGTRDHDTAVPDSAPDVTVTSEWPTPCGNRPALASAALCGSTAKPCAVVLDEVAQAEAAKLVYGAHERPALVVETDAVHVLSNIDDSRYLQRDKAGKWTSEALPVKFNAGFLAPHADGIRAVVNPSSVNRAQLYQRKSSGWTALGDAAGGRVLDLSADSGGCLHAALHMDKGLAYGFYKDSEWIHRRWPDVWAEGTSLTLTPTAQPVLTYWFADGGKWQLSALEAGSNPEKVGDPRTGALSAKINSAVIYDGAAATRYVLFHDQSTNYQNGTGGLILATRKGNEAWKENRFSPSVEGTQCSTTPTQTGDTCTFDYTAYSAHDLLVNASGELRIIYSAQRRQGTWSAVCTGPGAASAAGSDAAGMPRQPPPIECNWQGDTQKESWLIIAAVTDSGIEKSELLRGKLDLLFGTRAGVRLSDDGTIHLAFYTEGSANNRAGVRYLQLASQ